MTDDVRRSELTVLEGRVERLEKENQRQMEAQLKRWDRATWGVLIVSLLITYSLVLVTAAARVAASR